MVLALFLGGDEFLPRFYSFSRLQLQEIGPFIDENWSLFNGLLVSLLNEFHISIAL
jgi:hypothetical protein